MDDLYFTGYEGPSMTDAEQREADYANDVEDGMFDDYSDEASDYATEQARLDRWNGLTDQQREREISDAIRRES